MGPKYENLKNRKEIDKILPKKYYFKNYRDCLYGLSDIIISLQKEKFAQKGVTVYIEKDELDGIEKLDFRRPKKHQLLRKRYVNEEEWNLALSKFSEEDKIYYEFKEQTPSRGNHSSGKCLLDFEITKPNQFGKRECLLNIRASIVPYNLFYDMVLIHNLISEAKEKCKISEISQIELRIGLLTVKKGPSYCALICMGYHFSDLRLSSFFQGDIDRMFDNIEHPSTFKAARISWDNAFKEMMYRIDNRRGCQSLGVGD